MWSFFRYKHESNIETIKAYTNQIMLNSDCLYHVTTFLYCKEHSQLNKTNKELCDIRISEQRKKEYLAARIVVLFVRKCAAHRRIIELFIDKCFEEPNFRSRYLFVHMTEDPHICFRTFPLWICYNIYREHLHSIIAQRPGLLQSLYAYVDILTEIVL